MTSWKTKIKVLMGKKEIWEYDANIRKNEFNDLLRKYYTGKEPVFDLARFESSYPDGKRSTFTKEGKSYFDLAPEYTYDDGHLNQKGRQLLFGNHHSAIHLGRFKSRHAIVDDLVVRAPLILGKERSS